MRENTHKIRFTLKPKDKGTPKFYILTPDLVPIGQKYKYGPNKTLRARFIEDNQIRKKIFNDLDGSETQELDTPVRNCILNNEIISEPLNFSSLGKGGFGSVFLAIMDDTLVACKRIKLSGKARATSLYRERNILGLSHPNIVRTIAIYQGPKAGIVIMEKVSSINLQDVLCRIGVKSDRAKIKYVQELCLALQYLHQNNVLHMDVKPLNMLVERDSSIKLADFGNSVLINGIGKFQNLGTTRYTAPEVYQCNMATTKADIFSVGITMWQLIFNKIPYDGVDNDTSLLYQIVRKDRRPVPEVHPYSSQMRGMLVYQETYKRCWEKDPDRRPTLAVILHNLELCKSYLGPSGKWIENKNRVSPE